MRKTVANCVVVTLAVLCGDSLASEKLEIERACNIYEPRVFVSANGSYQVFGAPLPAGQVLGANAGAPSDFVVRISTDQTSRFVQLGFTFKTASQVDFWAVQPSLGFEHEVALYNYDDATTTGNGPAYVLDAQGAYVCNVPNCYRDTQLLNDTNSMGEPKEVVIGYGSYRISNAGFDSVYSSKPYMYGTRATTGRGNSSIVKERWVKAAVWPPGAPRTPYTMFQCSNAEGKVVLAYQAGVRAPVCFAVRNGNVAPCR